MATTAAAYADVAKEVFDSNRLKKMFYDKQPFLDRIQQQKRVVIGKRAQVPIHAERAGGTSVFGADGGTLNTASQETVDRAEYILAYTWFPVEVQFGALNEISGGLQSVGEALEHMVSSAVNNSRNQVQRQFLTGHGRIAQADTDAGGDTTVELATTATVAGEVSGRDALRAGWLTKGDVIDIGTTSDYDSISDGLTITAVNNVATPPTVTTGASGGATTLGTHFVSLHDVRGTAGTGTLLESAGLVTIAGTESNTVGAINGATETWWNPAAVDDTSTLIDHELLLSLSRSVLQTTGDDYTYCLTSYKQLDNIYAMLQSQVRFNEDIVRTGNSASTKYRNMEIVAIPSVPDNFFFFLTLEDLELVVGDYDKPVWASEVQGTNKGLAWNPGTTKFSDAIVYSCGLAARRRNSHAAATLLTA